MGGGGASFSDQEEKDQEAKKEGFGKTEEEEKEEMTSLRRSSVPHELESALIGEGGQMSKNENNDSSSSEEGGRVVVKSKKIGDSRYFPSLENDEDEEESADDTKNENNNTTNNNNNKGEGEEKTYEEGEIRQTRTEEDDLKSEEASMNEKVRRLSVRVSNNEDETTTTMMKKNNNNNNQDIDENDVNLPRDLMSAAIGDDSLDSPILPPVWAQIRRRNSASEGREQISYDFVDEAQGEQRRSYAPTHRDTTDDPHLKAQLEQRVQQQQSTHQSQTLPFSQPYRMPENHGATRTLLYRLLCPNARAGSVIGKNGEKVKQLQRDSGAKIKVEPPVDSTIAERVIAIEAQDVDDPTVWAPSQIALLRIVETIVLDAERNTTIGAAEENNGHIVIRLLLPSSQIRNVIGRFGNVIERIRVGSGSHVRVLPSSETPRCAKRNDEVLQISAESMENVASALAMITTQLRLDPPVRAHELPGGTKVHCDRASSEAIRRAASGIVNEGGILTSVETTTTTTQQQQQQQQQQKQKHQQKQKPPISPTFFDATSPDVGSYYAQKVSPGSSDISSSDSPQSPGMYSSSQAPMVHAHGGAYAEQFPDSSDVCGLFNISNFEGLDDTEPESRIAPGIVTRTFCVFEIKNALDSASKKRAKGIIELAAEETKCKVTQRPIGEEQVKNKSMLLTVSGTTEKVVAVKTLVKMRLAKGFAESKREERSSFAAGRRASGEYYHHPSY